MSLVDEQSYVYRNLKSFIENGYGASTDCNKPTKYLFKITQPFVDDIESMIHQGIGCKSYYIQLGKKYGVSEKFIRQYRDAMLLYKGMLINKPKEKSRMQLVKEVEDLKREVTYYKREVKRLQIDVDKYSDVLKRVTSHRY